MDEKTQMLPVINDRRFVALPVPPRPVRASLQAKIGTPFAHRLRYAEENRARHRVKPTNWPGAWFLSACREVGHALFGRMERFQEA